MAGLDEIKLDPFYLTLPEKQVIDSQLAEQQGTVLDAPIAEYVKKVNKFSFIATVRSCSGHGYPGHVSFRFTKQAHEKFIATGIKPLIDAGLCHIQWEVGNWLPTPTGLYFRWNARYTEDNRDHFYAAFLGWLERESPSLKPPQ